MTGFGNFFLRDLCALCGEKFKHMFNTLCPDENLISYTFRRTHVTEHLRNGAALEDIQAQTGHKRGHTHRCQLKKNIRFHPLSAES
jgi:hypothetical protein